MGLSWFEVSAVQYDSGMAVLGQPVLATLDPLPQIQLVVPATSVDAGIPLKVVSPVPLLGAETWRLRLGTCRQ